MLATNIMSYLVFTLKPVGFQPSSSWLLLQGGSEGRELTMAHSGFQYREKYDAHAVLSEVKTPFIICYLPNLIPVEWNVMIPILFPSGLSALLHSVGFCPLIMNSKYLSFYWYEFRLIVRINILWNNNDNDNKINKDNETTMMM